MNQSFSRLATASIVAFLITSAANGQTQEPSTGQPAGGLSGDELMLDVQRRTAGHSTISARIRLRTDLLGEPLIGSGLYAQLRSSRGLLLRLELAVQVKNRQTSMKQVCDGRRLWIHRRMGQRESLGYVDLRQVEEVAQAAPQTLRARAMSSLLATGGLPKLLSQLQANFDFDAGSIEQATLGAMPVWRVNGSWRRESLALLAPDLVENAQPGVALDLRELPAHIPHGVTVTCGQDNLFPYRIAYQRTDTANSGTVAKPARPLVILEFIDVALGEELDPRQFDYRPGGVNIVDQTDIFIEGLGLARQAERPAQTGSGDRR